MLQKKFIGFLCTIILCLNSFSSLTTVSAEDSGEPAIESAAPAEADTNSGSDASSPEAHDPAPPQAADPAPPQAANPASPQAADPVPSQVADPLPSQAADPTPEPAAIPVPSEPEPDPVPVSAPAEHIDTPSPTSTTLESGPKQSSSEPASAPVQDQESPVTPTSDPTQDYAPASEATTSSEPDSSSDASRSDDSKTDLSQAPVPQKESDPEPTAETSIPASEIHVPAPETTPEQMPESASAHEPMSESTSETESAPHAEVPSEEVTAKPETITMGRLFSTTSVPASGKDGDADTSVQKGNTYSLTLSNRIYSYLNDNITTTDSDAENVSFTLRIEKDTLPEGTLDGWEQDLVYDDCLIRNVSVPKGSSLTIGNIPSECEVELTAESTTTFGNNNYIPSYILNGAYSSTITYAGISTSGTYINSNKNQTGNVDYTMVRIADLSAHSNVPFHIINDSQIPLPLLVEVNDDYELLFLGGNNETIPTRLSKGTKETVTLPAGAISYLLNSNNPAAMTFKVTPANVLVTGKAGSTDGFNDEDHSFSLNSSTGIGQGQYILFRVENQKTDSTLDPVQKTDPPEDDPKEQEEDTPKPKETEGENPVPQESEQPEENNPTPPDPEEKTNNTPVPVIPKEPESETPSPAAPEKPEENSPVPAAPTESETSEPETSEPKTSKPETSEAETEPPVKKKPPEDKSSNPEDSTPSHPQDSRTEETSQNTASWITSPVNTLDDTPLMLYWALLAISFAGIVPSLRRKVRSDRKKM